MDKVLVDEAVTELKTIQDMIRWSVSRFNGSDLYYGHGTDNSWDEAVALVLHVLQLPLDIDPEVRHSRLTRSEKKNIVELVVRRIKDRVPLPYLTNQAWFAGMPFFVDERVLIPRSPFAELIALHFESFLQHEPQRILDMCTGSGCIAIACAVEFPEAEVDAVDISPEALEVAELNIQNHGLEQQVIPLQSDLFKGLQGERYDLILANPPYVDEEDMNSLPEEFRFEPELGLASGSDGLKATCGILADAANYLNKKGIIFVEVGNSRIHLEQQFPAVPFNWIELEHGGHGVFALTREQLLEYQDKFES